MSTNHKVVLPASDGTSVKSRMSFCSICESALVVVSRIKRASASWCLTSILFKTSTPKLDWRSCHWTNLTMLSVKLRYYMNEVLTIEIGNYFLGARRKERYNPNKVQGIFLLCTESCFAVILRPGPLVNWSSCLFGLFP